MRVGRCLRPRNGALLLLLALGASLSCGDSTTGPPAPPPPPPPPPPPVPATVAVVPDSAVLVVGDTVRLSATVLDARGGEVAGAEVAWSSGDTLVATVDSGGLATGIGPGAAEITAASAGVEGRARLVVEAPAPTTVAVSPDTVSLMALGDTVRLAAEVFDQIGRPLPGAAVAWSSGDTLVATVDPAGLVTAASNGTATITATSGSASGTATVTVRQSVATVAVAPDSAALLVGDTVRLSATVLDARGGEVAGAEVAWSSGDTLVATVNSGGLATGIGAGAAEITAASAGVEGRARLVVETAAPTTVAVSPDSVSLMALGDTVRLAAEVFDQIGRAMPGAAVAWSSGDTLVATVDPAGLVTARGGGTAAITASSGSASGSASVSVMQSASSVTVTPAEATIGPGDTLRLAAEAFDANGNAVAGVEFSWSSSDPSVATVDGAGLVRGIAEGTTTIAAAAGDAEGTSEITVANPDRAALVALYEATDGPNWTKSDGWLSDRPLREWFGINTDASGRVNYVYLANNRLRGPIPPELGNLRNLENLIIWGNGLRGPIPSELGGLSSMTTLSLSDNSLEGAIPPELGNLGSLRNLTLQENQLTGPIPPELGNLRSLESLQLFDNRLTGPIPPELGLLSNLSQLWLRTNRLTGPIPPELGNLASLRNLALHWNRLTGPIPSELGNLRSLELLGLFDNRLTGQIPPELGNLASLEELWLNANELTGPIPPELGNLAALERLWLDANVGLFGPLPRTLLNLGQLRELPFHETGLCAPDDPVFQDWLDGLSRWAGETCDDIAFSHRQALMAVFESAGGASWKVGENWGSDHPLNEWHGVTADTADRVTELDLSDNGLTGTLAPDIGNIETLERLRLGGNPNLTGDLPRPVVRLPALDELDIGGSGLCIPPSPLFLDWLDGVGSVRGSRCPDDHGHDRESAGEAPLDGTVSGELNYGTDVDLFRLEIPWPGTLDLRTTGDTQTLLALDGGDGQRWGEGYGPFGILRRVTPGRYYVEVSGLNSNTTGAYALELSFEALGPGARAYLTQAVQSHDGAVPLVAGEDALLRVFVTAPEGADATMPPVRATFHRDGAVASVVDIPAGAARVPTEVMEADLDATANAVIPGSVVGPGLEMVVEIDPEGTLDPSLGIGGRIPEEGRLALDVRRMPDFDVTAVPLLYAAEPDSSGFKATVGLTAEHEVFYETRDWLPVADMEVSVREPLLVDYDPKGDMPRALDDIEFLRVADGASGYYMGVPPWMERGILGIAFFDAHSSVSRFEGHTVAHEFGHNLSLRHAPCGGPAGVDPRYPHRGGLIGGWGYDFTSGELVNPEWHTDLMTYCRAFDWISDYSFAKAADYRTETGASMAMASPAGAAAARVLIVRGGRQGGRLRLDPSFVLDAPATLPAAPGPYRLSGTDAAGRELFSHGFAMSEIADVEEPAASFVFAIPAPEAWAGGLDRITLTGPEGTVALGRDGAPLERLVLDANTGRIRAILRGEEALADTAMHARTGPGHTVTLLSRGIPGAEAWRR